MLTCGLVKQAEDNILTKESLKKTGGNHPGNNIPLQECIVHVQGAPKEDNDLLLFLSNCQMRNR
jgi:hypothetical protein